MAQDVANKAKEVVVEDSRKAQAMLKDAVKSRAYLYPIKGIYYFFSHRTLWKPLTTQLFPMISTAITVTTLMFVFTYLPQAALLTLVNGPLAFINTILLVLSESATLTNAISRSFFLDEALLDTFDGTLLSRDQTALVARGREVNPRRGTDYISRLGKLIQRPFARFSPKAIIRYLIYLPLNMIPGVGTALFILLQGRNFGPMAHARYFQLKSMSKSQQGEWVGERRAAYTGFGVPAVLLEMVPFVGMAFAFTNTVGAALWAADVEEGRPVPQTARLEESEMEPQETGVVGVGAKKEL